MAQKGQKFNKYSEDLINEVLYELKIGKSSLQISREKNIPDKTIRTWKLKRVLHPELYPNQGQKKGRKSESNLTREDWKERYEILKKFQAFLVAQREKK